MTQHKMLKIVTSILLTLSLAVTVMPSVFAAEDASQISDEIVAAKKQADAQAEKLTNINNQIDQTNKQIDEKTKQQAQNKEDLKNQKASMGDRARVMYMYGTDGYLQYLFSSENISDLFANLDRVKSVVRADRDKVEQIQTLETQVKNDTDALKAKQADLQRQKTEAEKVQKQYNDKVAEEQKKLEQYANTTGSANADSSATNTAGASGGNSTETTDQMDFICAVVAAECNANYEGSLAVISCVMNRVDSGRWGGHDAVSVLKAPGQFAAYLDGPYKRYLGGKYPDYVKKAVTDCMIGGIRNHHYESFRSGSSYGVWNCGGNSYR